VTTTPGGLDIQSQVCGQPIGSVASQVVALDKAYKGAWAAAGPQANPAFVGRTLDRRACLRRITGRHIRTK